MPNLNIDTTDPAYQQLVANFDEIRTVLRPRLRRYWNLRGPSRLQWRQEDELLRVALLWAERVTSAKEDA